MNEVEQRMQHFQKIKEMIETLQKNKDKITRAVLCVSIEDPETIIDGNAHTEIYKMQFTGDPASAIGVMEQIKFALIAGNRRECSPDKLDNT